MWPTLIRHNSTAVDGDVGFKEMESPVCERPKPISHLTNAIDKRRVSAEIRIFRSGTENPFEPNTSTFPQTR